MAPNHRLDGMCHPLVLKRFVELIEAAPTGRAAPGVSFSFPMMSSILAPTAVHGQGGKAELIPVTHPIGKRRASAAMHQDHARNGVFRRSAVRHAENGEGTEDSGDQQGTAR